MTNVLKGIGRSCAVRLSKDGWNVVLSARRETELNETAALCPGETLVVAGDVSKEADVTRLFEETVKKFGMSSLQPHSIAP
jgi:NAD(P)-dependent dehydrogenase (short-subunit alcohol dehydrogenase family)